MKRWYLGVLGLACVNATAQEPAGPNSCHVHGSLEYFQRGADADVETTIENYDCAASMRPYVIEAMIRADDADGPEKLTFPESWSRDDDQPVVISKRYPIGDNVDLLRVKIRKLRCKCAEESGEEPEPASNP